MAKIAGIVFSCLAQRTQDRRVERPFEAVVAQGYDVRHARDDVAYDLAACGVDDADEARRARRSNARHFVETLFIGDG